MDSTSIIQLMSSLHESCGRSDDAMSQGIFQSVCYMLCFRANEIVERMGVEALRNLGWCTILSEHPELLNYCMDAVAAEFRILAARFGLVDQAQHALLRSCTSAPPMSTPILFFPFDPYLLRQSCDFVSPLYLSWKSSEATTLQEDHCALPQECPGATDSENDDDTGF